MIIEGFKRTYNEDAKDFSSVVVLLTIAVGTSIDAFAVGISFALLDVMIWKSGILIGLVTFLASMTAIRIGKSAGERTWKQGRNYRRDNPYCNRYKNIPRTYAGQPMTLNPAKEFKMEPYVVPCCQKRPSQ